MYKVFKHKSCHTQVDSFSSITCIFIKSNTELNTEQLLIKSLFIQSGMSLHNGQNLQKCFHFGQHKYINLTLEF